MDNHAAALLLLIFGTIFTTMKSFLYTVEQVQQRCRVQMQQEWREGDDHAIKQS